ncbi:cation:H+ antiporter [Haladaptatus litoreus]|uniref:Cation:H+ antiporter n=1 Tax=Haladaptatus litoreus TaxID=553468 RepID=A0A1N7EVQ3_9EURY|nr:sodium:calcium antiporter [Haladaptatus litoreus]SIR92170.1 cation:H+ antiporter [Haladaptatus litoreus]
MEGLLWSTLVAIVATAVVWKGSGWLEDASEQLAAYYGLPAIVQGAIITAVGSSFPELSSTVLSTLLHGEFDLGVGAIVGSAIFNILVIPGVSGLVTDRYTSSRDVVYKEALFYMLAVASLLLTFALAVIYNPLGGGDLTGEVTRLLVLPLIGLYGLYVFIQYLDSREYGVPQVTSIRVGQEWLRLITSLVVIVIAVEGLVRAALTFGEAFGTPPFLWGLTILAAATSLPDAFVSVQAARKDEDVTSLANVLGSNTFDLLVAIPAGVLIAGAAPVDFALAVPMMGVLVVATVILFSFLRTSMELTTTEAYSLVVGYTLFLCWMILETTGVVRTLPWG